MQYKPFGGERVKKKNRGKKRRGKKTATDKVLTALNKIPQRVR